ncbi:cytochrome b [Loktanella fryxellensis]|uniref:cytochrome b n=1 Tax=Loktanella fryxellensis TaxID=245187 RepID=UPI000B7E04F9|nr:cytochrome b/b6 domain-containing protein [Loktanella fryxellensis]
MELAARKGLKPRRNRTDTQKLGLTVLLLVVVRVLWLRQNPAPPLRADLSPWKRQAVRVTHIALYGLMLGFPISGIALTVWSGESLEVYSWSLYGLAAPDPKLAAYAATFHNLILPALFYGTIAAHLSAVTKHHFADRRTLDVRRMLR